MTEYALSLLGFRPEELRLQSVKLADLVVAPDNVRRTNVTGGVSELAANLRELGQQQPILVEPGDGRYKIVVGQRRYLAAKELGAESLLAIILPRSLSDDQRVLASLSENLQRRDLDPHDKAAAFTSLKARFGSNAAVARAIGTTTATVRYWLGYDAVPAGVKDLVDAKRITVPVALRISRVVENEDRALEIANEVAKLDPIGEERERVLSSVERNFDRPVDVILAKAREERDSVRITFVLPDDWGRQIADLAREEQKTPSDIAREATIEWLQAREL